MRGGLLGHWACWTRTAVEHLATCELARGKRLVPAELLTLAEQVTDANAVIFDASHRFAGCIPGIHQVLYRQGLLATTHTLDAAAGLSPGQAAEIDRVRRAYPRLTDDAFVAEHLEEWLR